MVHEYSVKRKVHEQAGSFLVCIPKIWAKSLKLHKGSMVEILFNGQLRIIPLKEKGEK